MDDDRVQAGGGLPSARAAVCCGRAPAAEAAVAGMTRLHGTANGLPASVSAPEPGVRTVACGGVTASSTSALPAEEPTPCSEAPDQGVVCSLIPRAGAPLVVTLSRGVASDQLLASAEAGPASVAATLTDGDRLVLLGVQLPPPRLGEVR